MSKLPAPTPVLFLWTFSFIPLAHGWCLQAPFQGTWALSSSLRGPAPGIIPEAFPSPSQTYSL